MDTGTAARGGSLKVPSRSPKWLGLPCSAGEIVAQALDEQSPCSDGSSSEAARCLDLRNSGPNVCRFPSDENSRPILELCASRELMVVAMLAVLRLARHDDERLLVALRVEDRPDAGVGDDKPSLAEQISNSRAGMAGRPRSFSDDIATRRSVRRSARRAPRRFRRPP